MLSEPPLATGGELVGKSPHQQFVHQKMAQLANFGRSCVSIRTKAELDSQPEARALALDRHHRSLMTDARSLEEAIVRKRGELEESLIRIDELSAAIAHREAVLANPAPRREEVAARHQAAHDLYAQIAAAQDAAEASGDEGGDYSDEYEFDVLAAGEDADADAASAAREASEAGRALDYPHGQHEKYVTQMCHSE